MSVERNIDKGIVARSFSRGKTTYNDNAKIQQRVSLKLIKELAKYPQIRTGQVLEIGCCTGILTELLLSAYQVETLYLNDLVPSFHDTVMQRIGKPKNTEVLSFFGDIEELTLPQGFDLVISSSTFQWLANLDALFEKIAMSLNEGGVLAFSIFGPGTLIEFKELTGIGLNYSSIGAILDCMEKYFDIEEEETVKDQLFFSSPRDILKHLQATGVSGVKKHKWTPGSLRQFEKDYAERFGTASGIPVSYVSSYIIGSKK